MLFVYCAIVSFHYVFPLFFFFFLVQKKYKQKTKKFGMDPFFYLTVQNLFVRESIFFFDGGGVADRGRGGGGRGGGTTNERTGNDHVT